jgi:hypothetical protein
LTLGVSRALLPLAQYDNTILQVAWATCPLEPACAKDC